MAKEITAYQAKDGSIHLDKNSASMIDFVLDVTEDVTDFLTAQKATDKDGSSKRLILGWERWRMENVAQRTLTPIAPKKPESVICEPIKTAELEKEKVIPHLRKVAIIGPWPANHALIKKEFLKTFDLRIYTADQLNEIASGVKDCKKIFVMRKFVSHKHTDALRKIGQEPFMINGGMGELQAALRVYAAT